MHEHQFAVVAVVWMPALRATLAAALGAASALLIDIVAERAEKLTPDVHALIFATFVRNGLERATDEQFKAALRRSRDADGASYPIL